MILTIALILFYILGIFMFNYMEIKLLKESPTVFGMMSWPGCILLYYYYILEKYNKHEL